MRRSRVSLSLVCYHSICNLYQYVQQAMWKLVLSLYCEISSPAQPAESCRDSNSARPVCKFAFLGPFARIFDKSRSIDRYTVDTWMDCSRYLGVNTCLLCDVILNRKWQAYALQVGFKVRDPIPTHIIVHCVSICCRALQVLALYKVDERSIKDCETVGVTASVI
jgi:hypothetical protein